MARLLYGTTTYGLNASNREQNAASFLQADIDDLTDATALVFPAIGAALMLLFGGLLLTTALRCRLSDSKNGSFERTDKRFPRAISFYNTPNELCPRGTCVLQQENNDIVDAVMKEYGDLSHYQPERDHNANFEQSFALSLSRPEMVDKGVSPIYEDPIDCEHSRSSSAGSSPPIQARGNAELEQKVDFVDQKNGRIAIPDQRNGPVFSGIDVRSQCSFDDDSLELLSLHQEKTQGQNAQREGENSDSCPSARLRSCSNNGAVLDGDQRNVSLSQKAPSLPSTKRSVSLLHQENCKRPREKAKISEYDPSRLQKSNLQNGSGSSFGPASALSDDASDSKPTDRALQDPAASVTTENTLTRENVQRCDARSPMRKLALEKWLSQVQAFYPYHGIPPEMEISESDGTDSSLRRENLRPSGVNVGQERKRKTRTWPRAREMHRARRARFNKDDPGARKYSPTSPNYSSGSDADVGESSGSWFHHVRRPYSPRCGVSTRLNTRGSGGDQRAEQWALDRMPNIVEKERLGSPRAICATDVRCDKGTYRGAQCQESIHDSSESHQILATSKLDESQNFVEQQLRRASYFGGAQVLAQPEGNDFHLRGASSLGDQGSAGIRSRGAQHGLVKEQVRGASSFGGTQILAQPESKDCPLRGTSSLGGQGSAASRERGAQHGLVKEQVRGASSFGGTQSLAQPESKDCPLRGASSLSGQGSAVSTCRGAQHNLVRGARSFGGTQIFRGASSLGGQRERRVTDNSDNELRGASVFGGSQIISQVIKRKPSRKEALGLGNEPYQTEVSASEIRNASSLEDAECTSSITLTVARDSDEENSQCETDSLMSRRSYKNSSAVSVKSSNTVIAAETSSAGVQEREQPRKEDKPQYASSDRCDYKHHVDSQMADCTTWRARGRRANCVEAAAGVEGLCNAPEGSGVTCDESRRTPVRIHEAVRSTSKLSSDSILNVGKDISVMSAVLHALRQERDISRDRRKA